MYPLMYCNEKLRNLYRSLSTIMRLVGIERQEMRTFWCRNLVGNGHVGDREGHFRMIIWWMLETGL